MNNLSDTLGVEFVNIFPGVKYLPGDISAIHLVSLDLFTLLV